MSNKKIILFFSCLLGAIIILAFSLTLRSALFSVINIASQFIRENHTLGVFSFILLACLSVLLGPFTSAPLVPPAVEVWGRAETLLLLLGGWIIGNSIAYFIGFRFGYPLVSKIVKPATLDQWIKYADQQVSMIFVTLFRLGAPSETGYVFGLLKYDFRKYLVVTIISEAPLAFFAIYASFSFLSGDWNKVVIYLSGWLAIMGLALLLFRKHLKRHPAK